MVYINEWIDVNTGFKKNPSNLWVVQVGSISFQEIYYVGKPRLCLDIFFQIYAQLFQKKVGWYMGQGTLTVVEGSVQFTSSLLNVVL
jgi:hypothetical protein